MDAYYLMKTIVYLILSIHNPTTLVFEDQITQIRAGKLGEFYVMPSNDMRTLTIQPLIKEFDNKVLVVMTKKDTYVFRLKEDEKAHRPHLFVHTGKIGASFSKVYEDEDIKLLEGSTSSYLIKKKTGPISVNGQELVGKSMYLSKGFPVFLGPKRIY